MKQNEKLTIQQQTKNNGETMACYTPEYKELLVFHKTWSTGVGRWLAF